MPADLSSAIKDNQSRGKVGDFLKDKIQVGSKLSIVSAYFTIYAYEQLKEKDCLVRVIVNDTIDPAKVVTVYRTNKISKYWRQP